MPFIVSILMILAKKLVAVVEESELENVESGGLSHRRVDNKGPHNNVDHMCQTQVG